ncbi:fas apoptotic inhibitory molecule 1-like [Oppia nitens]|uniref:fas apoptotic inhibitory molecule 1-like n=1 Tax=Oppia nitens TaxID=1686743 RepID=UPI0023DA21C9|nr:fas apoptotic inhibitory molecule 1-like [Oppia nitens]
MSDLVAVWEVPLPDKVHRIEFEHGTTTGKRILKLDGQDIVRRDWMFKLVGSELFDIKGDDHQVLAKCEILINASTGFTYEYSLFVNGKQLKKFKEIQSKVMCIWIVEVNNTMFRVALEKETLDIWVNGSKAESNHEFADEGTEMHFLIDGQHKAVVKTISSGNKKEGIVYSLIVNDKEITEGLV